MQTFSMKYGKSMVDFSLPEKNLLDIIKNNEKDFSKSEEEVILDALNNPIGTGTLKEIVKPGEKICIVISDITRAWQKMSTYLPYVVDTLTEIGIEDKDILFIASTGSHRKHTKEEHRTLLGEKLADRFEVIDHDCWDKENLTYVGTTSFGTPVHINKMAFDCDHILLTGAIVFHLLAGWGGGKKSVLPGICSYETIMKNHALSLNPTLGEGSNPSVRSGNIINNPLYEDMLEAAKLVKPSFLFNVIMNADGKIAAAVAGDFIEAHEAGCKIVQELDGVSIKEKADVVIATAGGFPKDINLYQTVKTLINAREAVKEGGTIIILSECSEGFGNADVQEIIQDYDTMLEREKALRENFSIAKYIGYFVSEAAVNFTLILVSNIDGELVERANIKVVKTIQEALAIAYQKQGEDLKAYLMPYGANTLPQLV
ncbi:nickel-dependent lactate racemase [Clostridium formicaceticum]|uniref:LarA-like N-terminal domain-containing protein n=1 Tax=Clostridium formicaceticum TaxID=1497 RepID=A0AAC9RMG2_9CLOT|nr:nickel-dependent lactate racemase [Clostridium formicaceticum]AOY78101.1 hypothetical protein BJL90_20900 [Clostridium formicaceticum]ARE88751.1 hypothetical protein CLFO_31570 [Clostridium formicaceticum]